MNKKLKMMTTVLLLSGSLLSVVPANAATVSAAKNKTTIENKVSKQSGDITVKSGESGYINANNVALRRNAGLSSTVLERLNKGDVVYFVRVGQYVNKDGYNWVKVGYHTDDGYIIGYVAQNYID